MKLKGD